MVHPVSSCLALIRVRVPDRPGALGLVASRIGALKGDIVGIEVLSRHDGVAVDELAVVLPHADLIAAVTREINEVDGADTEAVSIVDALPEPRLDAVRSAISLARAAPTGALMETLTIEVATSVRADWCAVIDPSIIDPGIIASTPGCPADPDARATHAVPIGESGLRLAVGRTEAFRVGEIDVILAWCEYATTLAKSMPDRD